MLSFSYLLKVMLCLNSNRFRQEGETVKMGLLLPLVTSQGIRHLGSVVAKHVKGVFFCLSIE